MSHHDRFREHRIPTSLQRHVPSAPSEPDVVRRYAEEAYHSKRGVYFTEEQLASMPWQSRDLIESEAKRFYGVRRRG